jgi:glycosyltransferase involved in cell wall biosynthesis
MKVPDGFRTVLVSTLPPVNTSLSEYGRFLAEGLLNSSEELHLHVLADQQESGSVLPEIQHSRLKVDRCWRFNDWQTPLVILRKLWEIKPEVVLFNLQFATFGGQKIPAMLGLMIPFLARLMGFKVVTLLHNLPDAMDLAQPYFTRNALDRWLIQTGGAVATRLLLQSHRLVVTLERYKDILESRYSARNVEIMPLGSYVEPARVPLVQKRNTFLTFGKFGTYKRLEFLLESFEKLSKKYPHIELVIGGADHPNAPGYLGSVQARYSHLENVSFLGWIEDEALPILIRNTKALILSYEATAGSSGPLHLALSQGKPVIAPDFGDFRLVADHEGAEIIFYHHQNAENFERRFEEVILDELDLAKMGRHNLNIAKVNSAENIARRYLNLLLSVSRASRGFVPSKRVPRAKIAPQPSPDLPLAG